MFEEILVALSVQNQLQSDEERAAHLSSLRPFATKLWRAYRNQNVTVNYASKQAQEAYLIRYFPFYVLPLLRELESLRSQGVELPESELMEASFFGCGPGPEVIALLVHLSQAYPGVTMLVSNMIDIAAETWAYARSMVFETLAKPCWSPKLVEYRAQSACITDSDAMARAPTSGAAIAVVQNCFNEVPANLRGQAVRNVVDAFTRLAPGAIGIIIDRAGYPGTDGMLELAHTLGVAHPKLRPLGDGKIHEKCISCSDMLRTVPALITENMLHRWGDAEPQGWSTDGLIFANRIKYVTVAFEVSGGGV